MSLSDDLTRHQIFLQRLAGTQFKSMKQDLDAFSSLAKAEVFLGTPDSRLKSRLRGSLATLSRNQLDSLTDLAEYEAEFSARVFKKHFKKDFKIPSADRLRRALETENMQINNLRRGKMRKSLKTAYNQFARRKADEITQLIRDSRARGLGNSEIQTLIDMKIKGLHYTQARALATTSVNYTAVVARNTTIKRNMGDFDKVVWVSVLDGRTTEYCKEHDGNIYPVGEGPRPPAHWNCRSHIEPYFNKS